MKFAWSSIVLLAMATGALGETAEMETQKTDPKEIIAVLNELIAMHSGVTLEDHYHFYKKGKTQTMFQEMFIFLTATGEEYVVESEKIYDNNSKPKVVSYFNPNDDDSLKVLLSLVGGGSVKSVTVKKPTP